MFQNNKFPALNTLTIYLNISEVRVFIQITLCRNNRIQMDVSKNNRFSAEEAKDDIPRTEKRKEVEFFGSLSSSMLPNLSWKLKIIAYRASSSIPLSSLLELLC